MAFIMFYLLLQSNFPYMHYPVVYTVKQIKISIFSVKDHTYWIARIAHITTYMILSKYMAIGRTELYFLVTEITKRTIESRWKQMFIANAVISKFKSYFSTLRYSYNALLLNQKRSILYTINRSMEIIPIRQMILIIVCPLFFVNLFNILILSAVLYHINLRIYVIVLYICFC